MSAHTVLCAACGESRYVDVECDCDWLPAEDRNHCESCNPKRQVYPQPSVTFRYLYDLSDDSGVLDWIERANETAYLNLELNWNQRNIMCWAIRKCRALAETQPTLSDLL